MRTFAIALALLALLGCASRRADVVRTTARTLSDSSAVSFTSEQATAGAREYDAHCAACHGAQLQGGAGPALAGPNASMLQTQMHASVGDIFSVIATEMPVDAPASLTHDQYVEIMTFILQHNGYEPDSKPLTFNAALRSHAPLAPKR